MERNSQESLWKRGNMQQINTSPIGSRGKTVILLILIRYIHLLDHRFIGMYIYSK